jgi:small neutral amino acid transporter SnatA (MarC family)
MFQFSVFVWMNPGNVILLFYKITYKVKFVENYGIINKNCMIMAIICVDFYKYYALIN